MSLFSRRPRFQLSLGSMFVLFLLACVLLGLGIKWRQRAVLQQEVIRKLEMNQAHSGPFGVVCRYDFQQIDDPVQQRLFTPKSSWLGSLLGVDMIHEVKEVDFHRVANAVDFELLSRLGDVTVVRIWNAVASTDDLKALYSLDSLSELTVNMRLNPFEGAVPWLIGNRFEQIGKLSRLKELHLLEPLLKYAEWDSILRHPFLETLKVTGFSKPFLPVDSPGLANSSIERLYLAENQNDQSSVDNLLSRTKSLKFLSIEQLLNNKAEISDTIFESISTLAKLEQLFLHGTSIRGHELHRLHQLPIREMGLGLSNLDDQGLENIVGFKQLNYLEVGSTKISDSGMKSLAQLTGLQYLSIRDTKVSDEGFLELAKIKGLKKIRIRDTLITDEGVQQFRRLLPECAIDMK